MTSVGARRWTRDFLICLQIALFLAAVTVQAATIYDLFLPSATYFAMMVQIAIIISNLVVLRPRHGWMPLAAGGALFVYLLFENAVFAHAAGLRPNPNAIAAYMPLLSFVPFTQSRCSMRVMLRIFAWICFLYAASYVALHGYILNANFAANRAIHAGDADRGTRLYLAAAFASYAAFFAITDASSGMVIRLLMLGTSVWAIILSGFRTFLAIFVLVALLAILGFVRRWSKFLIFVTVVLASSTILFGLFDPSWNPFSLMTWDASANARAQQYGYALSIAKSHWLLGIGIANTDDALQMFLGTPKYEPLYATDLGSIGPLILLGIPGLLAFFAATYFCIMARPRDGTPELRALSLNCIVCGGLGMISPAIILEQNSVFLGLLLAAWLRSRMIPERQTAALQMPILPRAHRSRFIDGPPRRRAETGLKHRLAVVMLLAGPSGRSAVIGAGGLEHAL